MKRLIRSSEDIFAMSNVRGKYIKVEKDVPFSFYYSPRNSSHGPRVKPVLNPAKLDIDSVGVLKLCDDWKFTPGPNDSKPSNLVVKKMKQFFRKYLVLFLLVWDKQVKDPELEDYLRGDISLHEFVEQIDFYPEHSGKLDLIETVGQLEEFCREHDLVNFYGN